MQKQGAEYVGLSWRYLRAKLGMLGIGSPEEFLYEEKEWAGAQPSSYPICKKSVEEKELVKETKEEPELESVQDIIF